MQMLRILKKQLKFIMLWAYCFNKETHKLQLEDPVIGPVLHHFQDGQQPDGNMCRSQSLLTQRFLE